MGREYPSHPLVGVGAVVVDGGRVLLVKRATEPGKGKWSIPGGLVEVGEAPEEAVVRELKEEAGIDGEVIGLFGVYNYVERDSSGRVRYHFVILDYLVRYIGGVAKASSDAAELGFYTIDEALRLDLTETSRELLMALKASGPRPCGGLLKA